MNETSTWALRWIGSWRGDPIHRCSGSRSGKHRLMVRTIQRSPHPERCSMECRHCTRSFWFRRTD